MKFNSFNLTKPTLETLKRIGFVNLSPIQESTLPIALRGESILAQAPTGSGKSHSFIIPLIEGIDTNLDYPQALIIVPTIELGRQTLSFLKEFQVERPTLAIKFLEDVKLDSQVKSHVIITTPAKLARFKETPNGLILSHLKVMVLDEADMLSNDDFFNDIDAIVSSIRQPIQFLIFSATFNKELKTRLRKYVQSASIITTTNKVQNQKINYYAMDIRHKDRVQALANFIKLKSPYLLLVFAKTNDMVKTISQQLEIMGIANIMFHGKLTSQERKTNFKMIKANNVRVIVCSDLMARGIDFQDVSDVVSFDIPKELAFFFHRAGRTGRFDKEGNVYLFYDVEELKGVETLQKQGAPFTYLSLYDNEIREKREKPAFLKNKSHADPELQQNIKKALSKVDRKTVKPNYKKKAKKVREKEIKKHNRKVLKEKIKKEKYGKKNK